jgi:hypothetical protein
MPHSSTLNPYWNDTVTFNLKDLSDPWLVVEVYGSVNDLESVWLLTKRRS